MEEQILLGENNQYELDFSFNPFPNEDEQGIVENEEVITNWFSITYEKGT